MGKRLRKKEAHTLELLALETRIIQESIQCESNLEHLPCSRHSSRCWNPSAEQEGKNLALLKVVQYIFKIKFLSNSYTIYICQAPIYKVIL